MAFGDGAETSFVGPGFQLIKEGSKKILHIFAISSFDEYDQVVGVAASFEGLSQVSQNIVNRCQEECSADY